MICDQHRHEPQYLAGGRAPETPAIRGRGRRFE